MEAGGVLGFGCSEKFKNAVAWHARAVLAMRVPPPSAEPLASPTCPAFRSPTCTQESELSIGGRPAPPVPRHKALVVCPNLE